MKQMIFVGGIERSGTTVLATALARYTGGVALPESQFKKLLVGAERTGKESWATLQRNFRYRLWDLPYIAPPLPERSGSQVFLDITDVLLRAHGLEEKQLLIDHTPENCGVVTTLLREFELSVFVHVVRDPRAVIASLLRTDWNLGSVPRALAYWQARNELSERAFAATQAGETRVLTVRYEELCNDLFGVLKLTTQELADVDRADDTPGAALLPRYTHAQHERVAQLPSNDHRWRKELSSESVTFIENELADTTIGRMYSFGKTPHEDRRLQRGFGSFSMWQWLKSSRRRRFRGVHRIDLPPLIELGRAHD